MNTETMH